MTTFYIPHSGRPLGYSEGNSQLASTALEIVPVAHLDDVLPHALISMPEAVEWDEEEAEAAALAAKADAESARIAH